MSELPSEILNIVYKHSSNKDVLQCALTCKSWKESALPHFYKTLSIDDNRVFQTKKLLQLDPSERDRYFQYAFFTQKLTVHMDTANHPQHDLTHAVSDKGTRGNYTMEEWILLLEHLPNIQVLDLSGSLNASEYMQYILNSTDSDKILPNIRVLKKAPRGSMGDAHDCNDFYFSVCYKYRATITTLEVEYNSESFDPGPINGDVVTMLYHFNSLTHLTFNNSCDDQLTTFDIMDACPYLVSLNYKSRHCIPEPIVKNILGGDTNRKRLNNSFKELHLTIPTISTHYADYLKDYVAPHLDVLKLTIRNMEIFDWVKRLGLYNAVEFLRSLSKVKTASISWEPREHSDEQINTSTETESTIFFTLLNAMIRNKKMYCRANYVQNQRTHKSFRLTPDDNLYFKYSLKESDCYVPLTNQGFEQGYSLSRRVQFATPNRSTSIIGPEVIRQVNAFLDDAHPNLPLEILRYALMNCPNLQRFWYNSTSEYNYSILIDAKPEMGGDIKKHSQNFSNTSQENIKFIKTGNMVPSKELLCLIYQYLPAIENFKCVKDQYLDPPTELFEVDLTAFNCLKLVELDVRLFCDKGQDTAFLEIQLSDKDWEYYCLLISTQELSVTKTTLENMNEQISGSEHGNIRKAVIKCHKQVIFELSSGYSMVTEIHNGKIDKLDDELSMELFYSFLF
ncbi:hypothetical protein INT47_005040 [Mucor saturninus]|uniref:F-box domain-containing protein n=1 Tax=Mucor saturninus TaxID=64648 RepID=A0A8H7QK58_9FUNG|nr:hypothetical protein INT47_005040 [Mucor saturninus]